MFQGNDKKILKNMKFILIGMQVSIILVYLLLLSQYGVTSFSDRVIGQGMADGMDITQKINTYYIVLFALIPGITIGVSKLLQYIFNDEESKAIKYMNIIATLGIITAILVVLNSIKEFVELRIATVILLMINFTIVACKLFSRIFKKEFNFENLRWAIISGLPLSFFLQLVLHKFTTLASISFVWIFTYFIAIIILYTLINIKKINKPILKKSYLFFVIAPLMEALYLELYNILNQHNIFIVNKYNYDIMIYLILGAIGIIYYLVNRKKNIKFYYTKYYYPIVIITLAAILVTPPMTTTVNTDFFESANHGLGIYEFLTLGKIPVIETFDAHMVSNQITGIIYGILNKDTIGAMFEQYEVYKNIIFYIVVYFLLKKVFSRDVAFWITIIFPLKCDIGLENFAISIIAILTVMNAYKKQDIKSYLIYWISLAFLCIWQLDIGFAISVSTAVVLIYMLIKDRITIKELKLKNAVITFLGVIGAALIFYIVVCLIKDINPIERMIEFLKIAMSNTNWAYSGMKEKSGMPYLFCYVIMPLIVISTLLCEIFVYKRNDKSKIILLSLGLFYILNIQRGMVRHSLTESTTRQIISLGLIYLSIFVTVHFWKKDVRKFLIFYISVILLTTVLSSTNPRKYASLLESTINDYVDFKEQDAVFVEKVERIQLSDRMKNEIKNVKIVMDCILEEKETYVDLSNQTLLYALLGREKPVYVNQSPGLLSGEQSQQFFIEEIENYEGGVPVLLKAKGKGLAEILDGIKNDYRYYLVSEYVYQRYKPAVIVDGYEIWIENSEYDKSLAELSKIENDSIKIVSVDEYIAQEDKDTVLGEIPRIWGEYDINKDLTNNARKLSENLEINNIEKIITAKLDEIDKTKGNYLNLKIQSSQDSEMTLNFYEDEMNLNKYIFKIKKGEHNYRIRISTLYEWFEANINNIGLIAKANVNVINMEISEAEVIKEKTLN